MTGLGSDVKNVVCLSVSSGRAGGEQLPMLGKTSREETLDWPANPPVIKRTLFSVLDGASVEGPGYLCVNSLFMFCTEEVSGTCEKYFLFAAQVEAPVTVVEPQLKYLLFACQ